MLVIHICQIYNRLFGIQRFEQLCIFEHWLPHNGILRSNLVYQHIEEIRNNLLR